MEDIAGLDVEPADVGVAALARHHADPCGIAWVPRVREATVGARRGRHARGHRVGDAHPTEKSRHHQPGRQAQRLRHGHLHGLLDVERDGQVIEHHIPLGEREVVHHRTSRDLDVHGAAGASVDSDHGVLHGVLLAEAVGHRVKFPGLGVALGVRGVAAPQRAVEIADPDSVEFVGEFVGRDARLDERQRLAGVADHVGVRADRRHRVPLIGHCLAERARRARPADEAVAVPLGAAVTQSDAVHHPVADEPVVQLRIDLADRVGPVAQIPTVEVLGDRPGDLQVGERDFLRQRRVYAFEVAISHVRLL